jgi:hypothetical protein
MKASRTGIVVSALPSLIMLGLFYSLAFHMHRSLGGWPSGIGESGFPPSLTAHATVTVNFFVAVLLSSFLLVPVAIIVCFFIRRWRRFIPYLALYAALFFVCWGLMQFAPEPFLYWWRD